MGIHFDDGTRRWLLDVQRKNKEVHGLHFAIEHAGTSSIVSGIHDIGNEGVITTEGVVGHANPKMRIPEEKIVARWKCESIDGVPHFTVEQSHEKIVFTGEYKEVVPEPIEPKNYKPVIRPRKE